MSGGYLCIQGWGEGATASQVGTLTAGTGVDSILSPDSACNAVLGDFSTIVVESAATSATFSTSLAMNPDDSALDGLVTVALMGLRIQPLDVDTVMRCTMTAGSETYQSAAPVYAQEMNKELPSGAIDNHELFGSGVTNLVFHDLPVSVLTSGVEFELALDAGDIASKSIRIGSVFLGLQIPLEFNPRTFSWSVGKVNDEFDSRAGVRYASNGILRRTVSFDAQLMALETITGFGADFYTDSVPLPSMFRAGIANIGQPMLLSPYPYAVTGQDWDASSVDVNERLFSIRQNFFSLYGLLDRSADFSIEAFNADLGTQYRGRFRFIEVR